MDEFDILRRQATKLERHLEDCVSRYQQLAQGLSSSSSSNNALLHNSNNNMTSLPSLSEESMLRKETNRVLSDLQDLISQQLGPAADRSGKSQHALLVKRYREILFDLTGDFRKASSTLQRKREMEQLMNNNNANNNSNNSVQQHSSDTDHLLRERTHIDHSLSASSAVLGQATEIRADLKSQGLSLQSGIFTKMKHLQANVPALHHLMERISKKRSRDDCILAAVIASCILFTLWYLFG